MKKGEAALNMVKKIATKKFLPRELLYYKHRLYSTLGCRPTIVYTMGKVGSTTVFHAFQEQYLFPLTYHVHHLTDNAFEAAVERYQKNGLTLKSKVDLYTLIKGNSQHMTASQILMRPEIWESPKKRNIVTLVRDPFSTYLSHLFQNPYLTRPFLLGEDGLLDKKKVEDYISETFSNFDPDKDFICNWFDREFYKATGIDLYNHPFDAEKGYTLIREKRFNIAVASVEKLDQNLPELIKQLANMRGEPSAIKRRNVRKEDDKTGFYTDLKKQITVERGGLEKFYSTKFAKHFFTEQFRNEMINKWSGLERVGVK